MRTKYLLLFGTFALLLVAAGSFLWASAMMDSLFAYRSPIAGNPPEPGEVLGNPLSSQVIIILVDALREDTALDPDIMPSLVNLRQQAAWATMHSQTPSYSAPAWTTILTGAWPDINDSQPLNPPDDDNVRTFTQDDIFAAASRAGLKTAVAGYAWFEEMLADSNVSKAAFTLGVDHNADVELTAHAQKWIESSEYQLILLHLDQVDNAGHYQGGPLSQNWRDAAGWVDSLIQQVVSSLNLQRDTLIILSDHGQIDRGGHGGQDPVTLIEPFVMAGAGVIPGEYPDIQMVDVAPTVAALLGTSLPSSNQGQVLTQMLNLKPTQAQHINLALMSQKFSLFLSYAAAINQSPLQTPETNPGLALQAVRQQRLSQERTLRAGLAFVLAILPAIFLYRRRSEQTLWSLFAGIIYLLLFNLIYALLMGNTYSLSSVQSADDLTISIFIYTGISMLISWLVVSFSTKVFSQPPAAAARFTLNWVACILYLLALPVLWSYHRNGALVTWTLPEFSSMFLGFLSILQGLFVTVIGLALMGISALIARLDPAKKIHR